MAYWHFEYRPAPAARAGSYRRKYGTSWWGKAFLEALQAADNSGRLGRGKTYANKGLVLNIESGGPGKLSATVQGSMPRPYAINLDWTPWTERQAQEIQQLVTNNAGLLGQLLAGNLPHGLVDLLAERGINIFPESFRELGMSCTCPDWATPCKHQAALLYVIAADIDGDPFQLFKLRGLDLKAIVADMRGDGAVNTVPLLSDLLQAITDPAAYRWDEDAHRALNFGSLDDVGRRAMSQLPPTPAFAGDGSLPAFLDQLCRKASRLAAKL
ncbi:MAG: SWIM zinc finger family protein, partial [Bacteroidota bacterium]